MPTDNDEPNTEETAEIEELEGAIRNKDAKAKKRHDSKAAD